MERLVACGLFTKSGALETLAGSEKDKSSPFARIGRTKFSYMKSVYKIPEKIKGVIGQKKISVGETVINIQC